MSIVAPARRFPAADVSNVTTYCVLAPAAADGVALTTLRLLTGEASAGAARARSANSVTATSAGKRINATISARRGSVGAGNTTLVESVRAVRLHAARM